MKVRELYEVKTVLKNMVRYTASGDETKTVVSGIEFNRDMAKIFRGSDEIKVAVLPRTVRTIKSGAFH